MTTEKVSVKKEIDSGLGQQSKGLGWGTPLVAACPSKRWSHTMCLSDPDTAVLIGGETAAQTHCKDSLWKLELGQWGVLECLAPGLERWSPVRLVCLLEADEQPVTAGPTLHASLLRPALRQRLLVPHDLLCLRTQAALRQGALRHLRPRLQIRLCLWWPEGGSALQPALRPRHSELDLEDCHGGYAARL